MKNKLPLFIIAASLLALFPASAQNSALDAFRALPAQFQNGVLRLSADDARPNPGTWYFVAMNTERTALPMNIEVADGQVISQSRTMNPRTLITGASPIDWRSIRIDSTDAWQIAQNFATERGQRLSSVSFVLQQEGSGATPIWSIWLYDARGNQIGFLSILATNGSILRRN
jgi:hypothetical protein